MNKIVLGIIGLGFISNLFALDATDIEAQIQEIQQLPVEQRVEKMNELKTEIAHMNATEREKIILAIKQHQEKMSLNKTSIKDKQDTLKNKAQNYHTEAQHHIHDIEHNMPEIEHNIPEIEHNIPDIEHSIPEIEHKEVEHNSPEIENNFDKIGH